MYFVEFVEADLFSDLLCFILFYNVIQFITFLNYLLLINFFFCIFKYNHAFFKTQNSSGII